MIDDAKPPERWLLSLYPRRLPLRTRLFLAARLNLTPYARIAARLPAQGRILDLGCGHGLFAMTAARDRPKCTVIGIDHDAERIQIAAEAGRSQPNVKFTVGDIARPPAGPFAAIAMIDVLHYFAPEMQEALIREACQRLEPGGTLLVREVDPGAGFAGAWNRWYERIAVGIGFTETGGSTLHFRSPEGWIALMSDSGLVVATERCSSVLFADVLFACWRGG